MHSPAHILHSPDHIMQSPTQIMQSPPDSKVFAKKRDSRQYIVINEERLISEVQRRPILYDKALKGYRKPTIREHAWQEVASMLESTVDESKKRWRSLRDAFMKQYKQYVADEPSSAKKKKWLFYDQMEFLRPYLELTHELSLSRDEYMDEYMDSTTNGLDGTGTTTTTSAATTKHLIKREYFTTSDQKGNLIIQQAPLELADDDELHEEALDGSDVGQQLGGDGDVEEVEQLDGEEEVIDLYEERDIISEIFTTPGITSADSVSGGNDSQEELMQQQHHHHVQQQQQQAQQQQQQQLHQQQQQQHLIVKTCLTGGVVEQQTYQTTAQHHHQQQQQQQQHHQLLPVSSVASTSIAQLSAASNTTTTTTTVVLDDLKPPAQQQQPQQVQMQQQQQQHQQQQSQPLDIAATVSPFGLDPDERFLLSCSPILKRLSHKKNALARLKMQQILYEIEFGADTMFG